MRVSHLKNIRISQHTLITVFLTLATGFYTMIGGQAVGAYYSNEVAKLQRIQIASAGNIPVNGASDIPQMECVIDPFGATPAWGTMTSTAQLNRTFANIRPEEYVYPPAYEIATLTEPLSTLNKNLHSAANQSAITEKLFYSTRFMGSYDLDAGEWTGTHPGIDFKMPAGTPVRAIAGGRVQSVGEETRGIGKYVIIEHRLPSTGEKLFSVYGHLDTVLAASGDAVRAGFTVGTVGKTGDATLPHLHLQIDRDDGTNPHVPYSPAPNTTRTTVLQHLMNPIDFINNY